jgi:hypothetical protein
MGCNTFIRVTELDATLLSNIRTYDQSEVFDIVSLIYNWGLKLKYSSQE